jgi:enoyl-CoA hydratase/carnithine racemase
MSQDAVFIEIADQVAWITLNRPDVHNTINEDVTRLLPELLRQADQDPDVRVIVLQGAGEKAFCAGADIKGFKATESLIARRQNRVHAHWIEALDRCLKPTIASIQGFCLGGGLEIALGCDLRIATEDAKIGLPETGLGLIPGAGGSQRLLRAVGLAQALDIMLTGIRLSGTEAHRVGLVTRICPPSELRVHAAALAASVAAKAPLATQLGKEVLRRGADLDIEAGRTLEIDLLMLLLNTEDRLEAAAAFREKRPANFVGR